MDLLGSFGMVSQQGQICLGIFKNGSGGVDKIEFCVLAHIIIKPLLKLH